MPVLNIQFLTLFLLYYSPYLKLKFISNWPYWQFTRSLNFLEMWENNISLIIYLKLKVDISVKLEIAHQKSSASLTNVIFQTLGPRVSCYLCCRAFIEIASYVFANGFEVWERRSFHFHISELIWFRMTIETFSSAFIQRYFWLLRDR